MRRLTTVLVLTHITHHVRCCDQRVRHSCTKSAESKQDNQAIQPRQRDACTTPQWQSVECHAHTLGPWWRTLLFINELGCAFFQDMSTFHPPGNLNTVLYEKPSFLSLFLYDVVLVFYWELLSRACRARRQGRVKTKLLDLVKVVP